MKNKNSIRQVYFNGEFVPETEARISIYDSALMFGDMVFEMTRSFNGKQFKLREHLERLYTGIKILRIPMRLKIEELEKAVHETVERNSKLFNKDDEHRVLIDVSRGLLSIYHEVDIKKGPNVVIADFPLKWTVQNCSHLYDQGINLWITSQRDVLRGISMKTVIHDLAPKLGIKVIEKNIEPFDVYEADEAFMTSTPFCILPAVTLNKLKIGDGKPGKVTKKLIKAWSDMVGVDIIKQIKSWDKKKKTGTTPYKFDKNATLTMDIEGN